MKENPNRSFQFTKPQPAADSRSARPARSAVEGYGKNPAGFPADHAPGTRRIFWGGRCIGYTRHSVKTLRGIAAAYRSLYHVGKIELKALRIMVAAYRKDVGRGSATDIAIHHRLDRLRSDVSFYRDVWHGAAKAAKEKACKSRND